MFEVSREVLREVAGFDMHRGLVAAANRVAERGVEEVLGLVEATNDGAKVVAVLEGVGITKTLGQCFAMQRLGVDAVLFGAATADPLYRRSVRVSMGHVLRTPLRGWKARQPHGSDLWISFGAGATQSSR